MAKETISQTEGLCKEVANCIRIAYDKGYKQGQKDMEQNTMAVLENGKMIGREEAWECARKIFHMTASECIAIFDSVGGWVNFSASEAIAKIKEYEEKQKQDEKSCDECSWKYTADDDYDEWRKHCLKCINRCCFEPMRTDNKIKVGDEVIVIDTDGKKGVVWLIYGNDYHIMGDYNRVRPKEYLKRTGRHFDQIAEVLEQLKGE